MAHSVSNRTWIIGSVNADALFIEGNPHHAYRIPRSGREHAEITTALAMLEIIIR